MYSCYQDLSDDYLEVGFENRKATDIEVEVKEKLEKKYGLELKE